MSPTIHRYGQYRFFFFSREETRIHVHVESPDGEAKFWLEPVVALADFSHLTRKQLILLQKEVERRKHEIEQAWHQHFGG